MFGWITKLLGGGGFNKAVAGMNAEQAAAYFAAQKAKELAAEEAAARAANPPAWVGKTLVLQNMEQAELQKHVAQMHELIDQVHRLVLQTVKDLDVLKSETMEDMDQSRIKALMEEIDRGHRTLEQYKNQLMLAEQQLEKLHGRPFEEQTPLKSEKFHEKPVEVKVEEVAETK